ncbi:MAG TPA: NAD-dependent epimerase/dehydratase family protein [Gemmatimonadales bacterium]
MRVLLTGSTGFIGSHLIRRLVGTSHDLRCLVRDPGGRAARTLACRGAELVAGDVTDPESVRRAVDGCDAVVHLANIYSFWERDPRVFDAVNVEGTTHVMEAALAAGVSRVVHLSTVEALEQAPRDNRYARSKYAGEQRAWAAAQRGLPLVVLCPGAVLGRGDRKPTGRYIRDLARRHLPFALCTRTVLTMVHVRDVVEAIVGALERPDAVGKRYIVGVHQVSIAELNRMVSEIAGVPVPDRRLPGALVLPVAALLTGLARLTGRPPAWGLSLDMARVLRRGFRYDGSAAARELGFSYSSVREAVAEMLGVGAGRGPGSGVRDPGLATVMLGT